MFNASIPVKKRERSVVSIDQRHTMWQMDGHALVSANRQIALHAKAIPMYHGFSCCRLTQ
jgi:hypothetical protein